MNDAEKLAIIQRAKDILLEHFEVGTILVQDHDPETDETHTWDGGWGNRLARDRHVALMYQDRMISINHRDDDDDDEEEEEDSLT